MAKITCLDWTFSGLCVFMMICNLATGGLSVPTLTANKSPSVGESVILTCSSSSSTVYSAGLRLIYTWYLDGVTNPLNSRYTYSTSRDTLTISVVRKSDADKVFTCSAQEQRSHITSGRSNQLRIHVHNGGPENVHLDKSSTRYTTENITLSPSTCRADCYPCTYTWTHLNSTWSTNSAVLNLGQVSRNEAGIYRCTVRRIYMSSIGSVDLTLIVRFPPSSVSLSGNTNIVVNGINKVTLTCITATANPASIISWFKNGHAIDNTRRPTETTGAYGGKITSQNLDVIPTRYNNGDMYTCEAYNTVNRHSQVRSHEKTLDLTYHPIITLLTGPINPVREGQTTGIVIRCTVSSSPAATVTWYHDNVYVHHSTTPDDGNVYYRIPTINRTHAGLYKCVANNYISPSSQKTISVIVKFPPLSVTLSGNTNILANGANKVTLTCTTSTANPAANIRWFKNGSPIDNTSHTSERNGDYGGKIASQTLVLTPTRYDDGDLYTCEASNTENSMSPVSSRTTLNLHYRPDVSVTTTNVTTQDSFVDIVCNPAGVPDQYTLFQWTHQWDINGPVLNHPGLETNSVLKLTNLKYSHSGLYTCHASNGVECSKNPNAGSGHATLLVKAPPILIDPQPSAYGARINLASKINSAKIVNITFWSNAGNVDIRCYRIKDNRWLNSPEVEIVQTQTTVRLPVFSSYVSTTGTLASVSLMIRNKEEFGEYDIVLSNGIGGDRRLGISIVAHGPPETPVLEAVQVLSSSSVSVNWKRGFHGGLDQTIVIQISTDNINWQNRTAIPDGQNESLIIVTTTLQNLSSSTLYYIKMFAYNDEGRSDHFTEVFSFLTHDDDSSIGLIIGGAVGGVAIIIITVVVVVVCLLKQRHLTDGKKPADTEPSQRANIYESTNKAYNSDHVYANLQQPASATKPSVEDGRNIYELTNETTDEEHIYTGLSRTENVYVNLQIP